jgi:hypothetical protein
MAAAAAGYTPGPVSGPLCLYLIDEHGEAFDVQRFCSEDRRMVRRSELGAAEVAPGLDVDALPGTVCDRCGKDLQVQP